MLANPDPAAPRTSVADPSPAGIDAANTNPSANANASTPPSSQDNAGIPADPQAEDAGRGSAHAAANGEAMPSAAPIPAILPGSSDSAIHGLELLYLALAAAGAVLPWLANLDYMRAYPGGFDIGQFIALANINPAAQSLSRDLAIGSSAVLIWIVVESRRLRLKGLWLVLLCCFTLAFACGAPLFLYLRERRLRELAREEVQAKGMLV